MAAARKPVTSLAGQPLVLTIEGAAKIIGQDRSTAYAQIAAGTWPLLPCIKTIGSRKRVSRHLVEEWLRTPEVAS